MMTRLHTILEFQLKAQEQFVQDYIFKWILVKGVDYQNLHHYYITQISVVFIYY